MLSRVVNNCKNRKTKSNHLKRWSVFELLNAWNVDYILSHINESGFDEVGRETYDHFNDRTMQRDLRFACSPRAYFQAVFTLSGEDKMC